MTPGRPHSQQVCSVSTSITPTPSLVLKAVPKGLTTPRRLDGALKADNRIYSTGGPEGG